MTGRAIAVASAIACLSASVGLAAAPPTKTGTASTAFRALVLKEFDANGNGRLEASE